MKKLFISLILILSFSPALAGVNGHVETVAGLVGLVPVDCPETTSENSICYKYLYSSKFTRGLWNSYYYREPRMKELGTVHGVQLEGWTNGGEWETARIGLLELDAYYDIRINQNKKLIVVEWVEGICIPAPSAW